MQIGNEESDSSGTRATERRGGVRRGGDRPSAAAAVDVTRIEHENVVKQVDENMRAVRRLEAEVRRLRERLDALTRVPPE
jgi:hypothetical protein